MGDNPKTMRHRLRIACSVGGILTTMAWAGPASRPAPSPEGVRIKRDVSYLSPDRTERLDLYCPADPPAGRRFPGVVIIHGGGWVGGDKAAARELNVATALVRSGYVCVSVNYRLDATNRWPTNLQDCKNAVRFLRANADKYAVDADHIGVIGGSAGGHLALMVAYPPGIPELSPEPPYPGVSDRVDVVVNFYGITNLLTRRKTVEPDGTPIGEPRQTAALLTVSAGEDPQAWRHASPVFHVSSKSPPTLIAHGMSDTTVDRDQATELAAKLKDAGVEHQLIMLPGIGHTFDLDAWRGKPLPVDMRSAVIGFFDRHLKRTQPPVSNAASPAAASPPAAQPPNIVLIMADDLGWAGVGYHGGPIRTPNIDRLASEGVQLTNFHVSPMCSPTRAGLLTGRYPMRLGMARSVVRPWASFGLPPEEQTLPEALAAAGYRHRGIFGKWHLGHLDPVWHPLSQGFTEFRGMYNGAGDYWTRVRDGEPDWHDNATPLQETGYTTELIADAACRFIRKRAAQGPFFCYVPFSAPHDPLQAPEAYLKAYAASAPTNGKANPRDPRAFSAMVTCMDDNIGRIMHALQEAGVADHTLVWFLSDNGGLPRLQLNGSWRGGKLSVYEGGVRVPSAVWAPKLIGAGRKVSEPLINLDIMPTLMRIAGKPSAGGLDGVDISDLLTGEAASLPARDLFFFTGHSGPQSEQIAIRSADGWKLVVEGPDVRGADGYRTPQHRIELFRITEDPGEQHDRAADHPEVVARLGAKLIAFRSTEPARALAPSNQAPPGFRPPKQWRNHPTTQAAAADQLQP